MNPFRHAKTKEYNEGLSDDKREEFGQYFTPESIQEQLLDNLFTRVENDSNPKVLDPACGTGEFLVGVDERTDDSTLEGWEIENEAAFLARHITPDRSRIRLTDSLRRTTNEKFDIVIGNPPYFEFKPNDQLRDEYGEVMYGRVNIYSLFIKKGIDLLRDGGHLAFVVPPSLKNGSYFSALREYILNTCSIERLHTLLNHRFKDADQTPMLLILKKGGKSNNASFSKHDITIFSEQVPALRKHFRGASTLLEMGYDVETGSVVWNDNKDRLVEEPEGGADTVPLIWSHNVSKNGATITLGNIDKPQYIELDGEQPRSGPAVVVNRVVGKPGSGSISAQYIPKEMDFLAENHVNVILPPKNFPTSDTMSPLNVQRELNLSSTTQVVKIITGNTQISKNELLKLVPFKVYKND